MRRTHQTSPSEGAVIVTCPYDWLFAKGTIASINYFMPDLPVCVLLDGEVDTQAVENAYGVRVLRKDDIPDGWLREHSFGWGLTKMNALWHSPFEKFLHLDADTVVWGDLTGKVFHQNAQVVWPVTKEVISNEAESYVATWFFDPEKYKRVFPDFDWRTYLQYYACTGTYLMQRGLLDLNVYQACVAEAEKDATIFKFGEMGMLNLMLFSECSRGQATVTYQDFQMIFPDHSQESLQRRFTFKAGEPVVQEGDEQVLHMPDQKPLLENRACYSEPMTYFRLKFLEKTEGLTGSAATNRLLEEDKRYHFLRHELLQRQKREKLLSLFKGDKKAWRAALRKIGIST